MKRILQRANPVLFLDYDGVLHPDAVYRVRGAIVLRVEGATLFEWVPILEDLLQPHPDVQIVLATSWVRVLGFDKTLRWLSPELQSRVVGSTWHSAMKRERSFESTRFMQIVTYVHRHGLTRWLAIDNDDYGWPDISHDRLVRTEDMSGLGDVRVQQDLADRLRRL